MEEKKDDVIAYIYADQIIEPLEAMRTDFDRDALYELAENIKKYGLINPITVRSHNGKFEIVAGHRRFKACGIAGVSKIPCVIRTMSDQEVYGMRAGENLFRENVNPVDEAIYIGKLIGEDESKIPEIAKLVDRSENWVKDRLEILSYPEYFLPHIKSGKIKLGVAKALAQIEDEYYRSMFFDNALRDGMTAWTAEYYLAQWQNNVFKKGEEILPPNPSEGPSGKIIIRQKCAKCGGMAEAPNLTNVFVHLECPTDPH